MRTPARHLRPLALLALVAAAPAAARDDVALAHRVGTAIHLLDAGADVGSAFHYREHGLVVTNRHVLDGVPVGGVVRLRPVTVREDGFTDLGAPVDATVRYKHPDLDLAILIAPEIVGEPLRAAASARDRLPPRGVRLWVHGFPSTLSPTISTGLLAGHHREWADGTTYLLTDAALASGSSGGPATDEVGDVLGIATAVYEVEEEFGFNWGYLLPVRELERLLDSSGGAAGLPEATSPGEIARTIRAATSADAANGALMRGLEALARQSGSLGELAAALDELTALAVPELRLDAPADCVALQRAGLAMVRTLAERGVRLGLRADDLEVLDAGLLEVAAAGFTHAVASRIAMAQVLAGPGSQAAVLLPVAESMAAALDEAVRRAEAACPTIEAFSRADELSARDFDHDAVIAAMTDMAAAIALLEAAEARLPSDAPPIRDLDADARATFERAVDSIRASAARWERLPPSCRSFDWLDPYATIALSLDELVARLVETGMSVRREHVFTLAPGAQHTVRVRVSERGVATAFAAGVEAGIDIDMHVYGPDGSLVGLDVEADGVPVVVVEAPAPGSHRIVVTNLSDVAVEVRFVEMR